MLPRQVSNLNSSEPESDVLPITPQGNKIVDPPGSNLDSSEPKSDVLPITPRVNHSMSYLLGRVQNYKDFSFCKSFLLNFCSRKAYICCKANR